MKCKTTTNQFFLCLFAIIVLWSGCKKDTAASELDILTKRPWRVGVTDKNPATNPDTHFGYRAAAVCEKDDIYLFSADGRLTINNGTKKCTPSEIPNVTKTYTFDPSTRKLTIDSEIYFIAEISNEQVKYYSKVSYAAGYDCVVFLLQ